LGPNLPSSGAAKELPFLFSVCFLTRISTPRLWYLRSATPASVIPASGTFRDAIPASALSRVCYSCDATPASATLASHCQTRVSLYLLSPLHFLSPHNYILFMARARVPWIPDFRPSGDLGECSRSRLHLVFPASSGRHVFYSMFPCILYWAESLYLCMAECQSLDMYCSVTNACTRVVSFWYIYHARDVLYCLIPYLASGPLQPPVTHYLERKVIGTGRSLSSASGSSLSRKRRDWDRQVSQLRLVSMLSASALFTKFV